MKKIYSDIIILLAMLIAAPTSILAQTSGSVYVGYAKYDDQIWEYDGLSLDHDAKVGCAILLTKEMIAPYAGGTITGMRVGWDTSSMTGTYEGFVRTSFNGEDLTTGKATVKYSYSDANPGWNNLTLKEYVIPADVEQLVVGFTTTLKKDVCAIPMLYPYNVANSCYLWVEGDTDENGDPLWYDMKERGKLPILLIVKDTEGKFSYVPVISLLMPDGVVTAGTPADCLMRLKNLGSQTIRNIEVTSRQGEQTYSKKVTLSKTISTGTTSSAFLVPLMCYESGDVELSITKVNDKELAEPVGQTLNVIAVPKDVAAQHVRRPLVEYYESENNYRSARYYDEIVGPSLEGKENRLTFVCQHMDDQFMTGDDDATILALQLCDNDSSALSIPAMTIDRAMATGNILYQMSAAWNPMFSVLYDPYATQAYEAAISQPTFVSLSTSGTIDTSAAALQASVSGEVAGGVLPQGEQPSLTVYLMEKDVFSDSQLFWTDEEKEARQGEYTHANVIRDILCNAEPIAAEGAFTWSTTFADPDPLWNTENLYLVAFVHRNGQKGGKFMHVFNSAEGQISDVTGIEGLATSKENGRNIYDLSGRKVSASSATSVLPKGVYIVNGKKLVVK